MEANDESRHKVLVIDDEESMRDSCSQVLRKQGLAVLLAPDGRAGLDLAESARPDVVILDLKMPGLPGQEVLKDLKKRHPQSVVIVITGYPSLDSAIEAIKLGAYDFLPKPFTPAEVRTAVNRAIERKILADRTAQLEQEKQQIRDNFVAMLSHQMKSPLAAAGECLEVIAKELAGPLTEQQGTILEKARRRIRHLLEVVEDFVKLARIEATGRLEDIAELDLADLAEQAWSTARQEYGDQEIRFEVRKPSRVPGLFRMSGDASLLRELFINLYSNSIKYTPENGTITAEFPPRDADAITVKVSDTGCGIPQEELPYVFGEFFRGKAHTDKRVPGTGLGLTLVKRIVDAHRGTILLESTPGEGTTFIVRLPVSPPRSA